MKPERLGPELKELGIDHFIDVVVTSAVSKRKPAPDTVIECVELLNILPEECIMIGDSQADIIAGKAAGVGTVGVATGVASISVLAQESPDFVFDNLLSLTDNLDLVLGNT